MPFQCLKKATLDPNLPLVNLDELERKICCRLFSMPDKSTPDSPTSCHALHCQLPDIPHYPQPASKPVFHLETPTIAPYIVCPPEKPLDPATNILPHAPTPDSITPCPTSYQSTQPSMSSDQSALKCLRKPTNPSEHWAKC